MLCGYWKFNNVVWGDFMNCIVLEMENRFDFESELNTYLGAGYKIEASSCNSKYYKVILVKDVASKEA